MELTYLGEFTEAQKDSRHTSLTSAEEAKFSTFGDDESLIEMTP